jgi:hypothetical protein
MSSVKISTMLGLVTFELWATIVLVVKSEMNKAIDKEALKGMYFKLFC